MILGIDPKVDYAFRCLLGRESNKDILVDVLNFVLNPPPGREIVEVELLNPLNDKETQDDKLSILDIKARDQSGRQFNVEMQIAAHPHYKKRVVYYATRMHKEQLREGEDYGQLCQTISISFVDDVLFREVPDYHLSFHLLECRHHFPMTDDLEFHFLELPKFNKGLHELKTGLDVWLYFLRYGETIDEAALPAVLARPMIIRSIEVLKMITQSDIEREKYESRLKYQFDQNTLIKEVNEARRTREALRQAEEATREAEEATRQAEEATRQAEEATRQAEQRAERGEKRGLIRAYERILQRPQTPEEQLLAMSPEDLTRLAAELEKQALSRE